MKESPPGWPVFQPAVFTVPDRIPEPAREAFAATDVPRNLFGRYRASSELEVVKGVSDRRLVRFGEFRPDGLMCFDPATGQVVGLVVVKRRSQRLVNASLSSFADCVRGALDLFPYYRANAERREKKAAGLVLETRLGDVDAAAVDTDGFWRAFVADVGSGGYSTEEVLASFGEGLLTVDDELYRALGHAYDIAYKRLPADPHRLCPNCGNDALRIAFETRSGTPGANVVFWCAYCLIGLDHLKADAPKGARVYKAGSPDKGIAAAFPELRSVKFVRLPATATATARTAQASESRFRGR
jgi:SUKH-4 immunity protein